MEAKILLEILQQPNDSTCGPTCLQAVYRYYSDTVDLDQVVQEVKTLDNGGTLAVFMGCHALSRGYRVSIYTFDIQVFDPTWFTGGNTDLDMKLRSQLKYKCDSKIHLATRAYLDFIRLGGRIHFKDLTTALIRRLLKRSFPIITGLSATYLYRTARELDQGGVLHYDDVRGEPTGHFVILCGYNMRDRTALLADPLMPNPISPEPVYSVQLARLVSAIMLGILTFDANLLVITPREKQN